MVPAKYIIGNVVNRKTATAMTVLGIALVIGIYAAMSSIGETMVKRFKITGEPDEVIITQAGAMTVDFSTVDRESLVYVQTLPGVAADGNVPLVSPEINLTSEVIVDGAKHDIALRGITGIAPAIYRPVVLESGDWPHIGRTVAIGKAAATKLGLSINDTVHFEGGEWTIGGIITSSGRAYDQEIWIYLDDLAAATNRKDYSSYTLLTTSPEMAEAVVEQINEDRRFPITAYTARDYYRKTGAMSRIMATMGNFIAIVIALGAVFGGMNALYSAVSRRKKEIGVLRSLGYRKNTVLLAFLLESLVLSISACIIGILFGMLILLLPINIPFMVSSAEGITMNQVNGAIILAIIIGLLGGFLPALHASRMKIVDALK